MDYKPFPVVSFDSPKINEATAFPDGMVRMLRPICRRKWWKFWTREYRVTYRFVVLPH